MDTDTN